VKLVITRQPLPKHRFQITDQPFNNLRLDKPLNPGKLPQLGEQSREQLLNFGKSKRHIGRNVVPEKAQVNVSGSTMLSNLTSPRIISRDLSVPNKLSGLKKKSNQRIIALTNLSRKDTSWVICLVDSLIASTKRYILYSLNSFSVPLENPSFTE